MIKIAFTSLIVLLASAVSAMADPATWRSEWPRTDFTRHEIPWSEIRSGGPPKDGIPAVDHPIFVPIADEESLADTEPVIGVVLNGEAKAYPLQVLIWHEIANDRIADTPVAVTFCPLCNSAVVFDRRLNGEVYDFGVSGNLRNSDLIMWDRQTESWWQQLTGEGIVGALAGGQLDFISAPIVAWEDFRAAHPNGLVLSRDTGYRRNYGSNPYAGYDRVDNPPFLYDGEDDDRLLPKERVAAVSLGDEQVAYPYAVLRERRVVNDTVAGSDIVVFHADGTLSALDDRQISNSQDVGATGVFQRETSAGVLTFGYDGQAGRVFDEETGSTWNILGVATDGPLAGEQLERVVHHDHFWFAWAAFHADTRIYR